MSELSYASNSQAATSLRDPFAALLARLARLAMTFGGFAPAQASGAAYGTAFGFVVTQDVPQGGSDVDEPSMAELLARLAALGEDIRRVRQRYGMDGRKADGGGRTLPGEAEEH